MGSILPSYSKLSERSSEIRGEETKEPYVNMTMSKHLPPPQIVCKSRETIFRGFFRGDDPFKQPYLVFLAQIILMALVCQVVYCILKPLKQPKYVSYVLSGILIGPYVTGVRDGFVKKDLFPQEEVIIARVWSFIGFIYYLFLVAVKMDLAIIKKNAAKASIIGLASVLFSFIIILALTHVLPLNGINSGVDSSFQNQFAVGLSLTRFANVVYTFHELNVLTSELGQLATSAAMATEIFAWLWMILVISFKLGQRYHNQVMLTNAGFMLLSFFMIRPLAHWIIRRTPEGKPVKEKHVVAILISVLIWAVLSDLAGSFYIGILAIGIIIPSGPPLGSTLTDKIEFMVVEVMMPMFYLLVGANTNIFSIDAKAFGAIMFLVFMGFLAKFVGTLVSALSCKIKYEHALLLGLMLNIKGPFDLYIIGRWRSFKKESFDQYYTVLILSQVIVTGFAAPLINTLYNSYVRVDASEAKKNMKSIQTTSDNHELRITCLIHGEENVPSFASLLEAIKPTPLSPLGAYIVHIKELVGRATPIMEPLGNLLTEVKSGRLYQIFQAFESYLKDYSKDGSVQIKAYSVIAPYKSMHEYICKLAMDEEMSLILVPFHSTASHNCSLTEAYGLWNLNSNIQAHAPCTVGVLVDWTMRHSLANLAMSHYDVAIVFIGGSDDREALSLGIRLSGHPMAFVTVLRIIFNDHYMDCEDQTDRKLDFRMIEEFTSKNELNNRAKYYEVEAEDAEHALNAIRVLRDIRYNLIIVGRQRHVTRAMSNDEMLQWSENPELGIVGDFVASPEFCGSTTSVLVMQHYGDAKELQRGSNFRNDQRQQQHRISIPTVQNEQHRISVSTVQSEQQQHRLSTSNFGAVRSYSLV